MGKNVVSGAAVGVVAATGDATIFGAMAKEIVGARPLTSFDKGISKVSWMLIRFLMVMTPLVFFINGIDKGDWLQSLLFAVSVAVGLTPEMLPMIVTTNLAKGAVMMARRKTIVKRLNAIQNFGAMDILCTDKTGTLTQNKIILERHLDIHGQDDLRVLEYAWLNSYNQTGLKNLLDVAVLEFALQHELVEKLKHYRKIDEIPFDFVRRRMSVVVRDGGNQNLLVCKARSRKCCRLRSNLTTCKRQLTKLEQEVVQSLADHENSCRKHRSRVRHRPSYLRRTPFGSFGIVRRQLDLHHNFFRHIARLDGVQRRYYGAGAFRPLSVHSSESRVVMSGGCSSANHHDEVKSARKQRIVCDPRTIIGSTSKPSWKSGTCMKRSTIS